MNKLVDLEWINEAKNLVRRFPTQPDGTGWIAGAKSLPKAVHQYRGIDGRL